jgi:Rrf2 family protein
MFTSASQYAIRSVLFLAANSGRSQKWSSSEIAKELDVKQPFLAKILQKMARKKLISSAKGPNGGFYLSKSNRNNNLMRILDCFDDLDPFETCVLGLSECSNKNPCPLHVQAFAFREGMRYQFVHQSIADIAQKINHLELKI